MGMRFLLVLLCAVVFATGVQTAYAQNPNLSESERRELERQLADLEKQMSQTQGTIDALYSEGESLKRDIAILDGEIRKAKLKVSATEIEIRQLSEGIVKHTRTIGTLSEKIAADQQSLAQILRKTQEVDDYSLVEVVFSAQDVSDFFGDLDAFASIQEEMHRSFEELRNTQVEHAEARTGLEAERTDKQILQSQLVLAQREVEKKEAEKQKLLDETKGQEELYRSLKAVQERTAAQIRAALFPLRDAQGIPFGVAVQYAKAAEKKTGVRAALILAILSQESDLGNNVGQCLITNSPNTGDGKGKNTGTPFDGVMHPTRDVPVFMRITEALGRDWASTVVSCPQPGGWGGAMGPTQFIPSTWAMYEGRLASLLGVSAVDPWNASHAIMATGLYLSDVGAAGGSYTAEHTAAARYYAGGNWATSGQGYANSVMGKAANFQDDIDFLATH